MLTVYSDSSRLTTVKNWARVGDMGTLVAFGEIMLRLKSPGHERLFQSPVLEATFGGGESNVLVSLSRFGKDTRFVTALPEGPVGDACLESLRGRGIDVSSVLRRAGRMGIYFLENGAGQRGSQVIYDRADSPVSRVTCGDFDWARIFSDASWFHITGITPALTRNCADVSMEAVKAAKAAGLTVSIDLNFRKKLWKYGAAAPDVMRPLVALADVVIANEEDIQYCLGIPLPDVDVTTGTLCAAAYRSLAGRVRSEFPSLSVLAITLRESHSADHNGWSAVLSGATGFLESRKYEITDIVDRVGGGDAFSAGLICQLSENFSDERSALEFATAASALKHTIPGDCNLVSRSEVAALVGGDGSGRVLR